MSLKEVEKSLKVISRQLNRTVKMRDKLIRDLGEPISLSSRAIVNIHTHRPREAENNLKLVEDKLKVLRKVAKGNFSQYLIQPEGEYVEAITIYSIVSKKTIPSHKTLNVNGISYILGLLDAIGELRRLIYDRIREEKNHEALELFTIMEQLYTLLSPFAIYEHVAKGVRKKLDVARILVEETRSAITEEVRRSQILTSIDRLLKAISKEDEYKERYEP
ncbi:MAG: RNA-binding protein [Nitrososphaerales archaeon]|nr:RNA-binding protein [Nitrososphaerales archaeon]